MGVKFGAGNLHLLLPQLHWGTVVVAVLQKLQKSAAAEGSWRRWGVISTSSSSSLPQVLQKRFQPQSRWSHVEMLLLIVLINPWSSHCSVK